MNESTVNFGLDVTTGNSTTSIDNLATSVDGLLEKYTKLMTELGKGDQVFGKVVKALGGHKGELDAAAREIDKVQKAMSGGTAKGVTADISSEFKALAQDLKTAFSGIPVEIKTATTQITGMAASMQNQLGKVTVLLDDIKEGFKQAGAASEALEEKKPKAPGTKTTKKSKADTLVMLGISVTSLEQIQQELKKYAHEFSANFVEDRSLNALKTRANELLALKEKASTIGGTAEVTATRTLIGNLNQEIQRREKLIELAHKEETANKWKTFKQDAQKHDADVTWATKAKTDAAEWDALVMAETTAKQSAEAYGVTVRKNLQAKKESQALAAQEAAQQKKLNDDIREYILATEAAYSKKKEQNKQTLEFQQKEAAMYDAGIMRQTQQRKNVESYFKANSDLLKQQNSEVAAAEAKKLEMTKSYFSQNNKILESQKKQAKELKTQQESQRWDAFQRDAAAMDAAITQQIEQKKHLSKITEAYFAQTSKALKDEKIKREELVRTIKEQALVEDLGVGTSNKQGIGEQVRDLIQVLAKAEDATRSFGKTSQGTIFESIEDMRTYKEQILSVREVLTKKLADKGLNSQIKEAINSQIADLDMAQEIITKYFGRGLNVRGTAQVINPEAIRLKEEIDLLNKYQDITDRVRQAKEKLNQTKGSKSDTLQARKEMEGLRIEQEKLQAEMQKTSKLFSAAGMSGSKAMDDIRNASKKLNNEMASFKGTISSTESSFKNMWGSMSMALGKFMLWYHTFSVGFGALRGMFNGLVTSLNEIMTVGEKFSNIQKVFRSIESGNKIAAGEDWARLTAQAERYGMAISDLAEPYQKWIMTMKATNMNIKEGWMLFEHMIASARPLGVTDPQGMSEYFAGLTQMISKGKANMEDFRQQLAEKIPGLYFSVKEAVAKAMKIDPKVFDFEGMVKKGSIPLNALLVAIDTSLLKFAQLGETVADSYSANVNRMKNAWETFLAQMSAGPVGSKINSIVTELTKALGNKDFQNALAKVASGLANIASVLVKLATVALPAISAQIRQFVGDEKIAESNPELYAATQRETEARRPKNVMDMLSGRKMWTEAEKQTLTADIMDADLIASIRKGYIYSEDGILKKSASATEALTHQLKVSDEELNSNFGTLVLQPLLETMEKQGKSFADLKKDMFDFARDLSIKAGGIYDEGSLLKAQEDFATEQKFNKAGYSITGIGYSGRLNDVTKDNISEELARNAQQEAMATFKNQEAAFLNSLRASSQALEQASDAALKMSPAYAKFLRDNPLGKQLTYGTQTAITETGLSEVDKGETEAEKNKRENMERAFRAEMERLDGALSAAQAGGSWATKIQKVANQANVKDITAEKFTPEMQAQLDVKRNAAVAAQQTDLYSQAMQQLEGIDAEIESRIAAGSLKNELKTQYEDIIKWQIKTTNDLEKNYAGLDGVDIQARVSKIQQAVERASEQALTQGNTPMEIIAKAEERAAKGRTDAWQSTHKELVEMEQGFSGVQIEQQFGLMQTLDEIAGTRGEKEKQRINEAAEVDRRNFKNTENMAVAQALRLIAVDEDTYNKRKAIFGDLYDAATTDADTIAIEKLNTQFQGLQDTFGNTIPLIKEYDRSLQAITDRQVDKKIANASNFTEYLNTRFSKEQGLFDNQTVATTKNFEKMYEVIGSGASEAGQTIQTAFTDAFMGTLKSWTDVWKSIQATFLKGLAAMMWEAKAKPIQLSIVSALTGVTPAIAGGSTAGQVASQAHDMVTGGSQTTEGVFTKLSKGIDEMTKSLNDFGKEALGLSTDLTNAITGGALGFAIGSMMFPDNVTAKIGAAIGGAAGEVIGETYGGPIGGAIGSAAGSVIGGAIGKFFSGEKKITDYGIRVSVDDEGLKFLDKYEKIKKSSSFNLSAVFKPSFYTDPGSAWSVGSKKERYSDVDPQVYKQISAAITTSFSTVSRQMLSLGLAPNFAGFSIDEKVSLKGEDPEALLQAWLNKLSGKMVDTALANDSVQASFAAAKKMGETSSDALTRLVDAMTALESGAVKANVSIEALAGGLSGIDLASYASDLSEALGGGSGVSEFFGRVEKFIGYAGTEGIQNIALMEKNLKNAIENINSFADQSGTRVSVLSGQKANLELTASAIETELEQFAAGAGWRKWLSFQDGELVMNPGSKYSTVEEMAAADPKWKAALDPMIAYVEELENINAALALTETKLGREENLPQAANIKTSSVSFWGDYQKALSSPEGMTPELAAAWDAAAKVAESIADMREEADQAAKDLQEQAVAYKNQRISLQLSALYFGIAEDKLLDISTQAQALNQNDLPAWFSTVGSEANKTGKDLMDSLVPGLEAMTKAGETTIDALVRLTATFTDTSKAAALSGTSLETISGATGLDAAAFSQALVDHFGSQEAVDAIFTAIGDAVYTDEQLKSIASNYWTKQAEEQAIALGTTLTDAKAWIQQQLATSIADPVTLEKIGALSTSINNMEDAMGEATSSVDKLKEAALAYVSSYDTAVSKLNDLKSEKEALSNAVDASRSDYMDSLQKEIDKKQEAIDKLKESEDSLDDFIKTLQELKSGLLVDAGFLSSTEKAGAALANFENTARKVAEGDMDARSQLSASATAAVSAAQEQGTYEQYISTFTKVYGTLGELEKQTTAKKTEAGTLELQALTASKDSLQAIYDKLKEEADKTLSITEAQAAYEKAKIDLATSTLDIQIATAQAEIDRHTELVEQLRKQYDETVSLSDAAKAYFDADAANKAVEEEKAKKEALKTTATANVTEVTSPSITPIVQPTVQSSLSVKVEPTSILATDTLAKAKTIQENTYKKTDEILYFMQEDNKKIYDSLLSLNTLLGTTYKGSYEYEGSGEETGVTKTDIGLKVILSSTQVKDSILLALREANDLVTVDSTSVIGLLTGIKTCACTCQCTGTTCTVDEYNETSACSAVNSVVAVADTSELATEMTDKAFSTISGAWGLASTLDDAGIYKLESVIFDLGAEDPDCAAYTYFIVPQTPMD